MNWLPIIIVSVQVSLVAAIGLVAGSWLRSAAHRHTVLLAALVCILASPLFYAGAAWFGISLNLPAPFAVPQESAKDDRVVADSTPVQQQNNLASLPESAAGVSPTPFPELPTPTVAPPIAPEVVIAERPARVSQSSVRADYIVVGLWLVGTLFSCAGVLRSQVRTNRILKAARKVGKDIDTSVIAEAERRLGAFRHLRMATTGKVAGPVVVGFLQPWILIPARYLETLSREELLQVLIHEGAHALRRDPLVALLQRIGGAMFWWHPLVHLVNRNLTRAREEVCDNFVLTHTEPETYGVTLLRLATLSPAMARLPLAIGMFDGRGKLEERIRGLLDSKRAILTHVQFTTGAAVLCAFALLSVFVAVTRVVAQNPDAAAPVVAKESEAVPAEALDAKDLDLILTYHGEADKPFYNLFLHVPPQGALQANPFTLAHRISEDQGAKLLKHLKESEFFEHAKLTENQNDPTTGPQYLLRIRLGEKHYEETLGWDVGTLIRLDALRKTLDGDAAKSLDQLLARLNGQRKVWESGEVVGDLKTTLSTEKDTYSAGQPIPIKLELTNVGQEDRQYGQHEFIRSGQEIVVTDEHGRQVPYLGGGAGLKQDPTTIKPGESKVIEDCDLSDFYYLRRPGSYAVAFRTAAVYKAGVPSSNVVRFRVTAAEGLAVDGDPMGKLLPLVSANFGIIGSPNAKGKVRPGGNRQETAGWQFIFVGPGGLKGSKAAVWLWLTDEAAKEAEIEYPPTSEYLGKVSRWHIYLHVPPAALELWPAVKEDLKAALERTTQTTGLTGAASEDDYRLLHDRYKAMILTAAKAVNKEEVAKLTDKFNETIGGKLLFAQVTLRVGPIAEHEPLLSKFFDPQRKISIGKLGFATSAKPIVAPNHDGQGVVLIATNPLGGNMWPDDLQVTLVMDPVGKQEMATPALKAPQWGAPENGFRARLSAKKQVFEAGEPIPVELEIENSGQVDYEYLVSIIPANQRMKVLDEQGRAVLSLQDLYQVNVGASRPENIKAGGTLQIAALDLGDSYYLRRPGRYTASWSGNPASAAFEFEVTPNPVRAAADGDPVGRLLPLVKKGWWLGAGPRAKMKPGSNWGETTGRIVRFVRNPPASNGDGMIDVCLMDEPAAAIPVNTNSSIPTSEYLGKLGRWHVYYRPSEQALAAWPTATDDIKQALADGPKVSIQINDERAEFIAGEIVSVPITIRNVGKQVIPAPETYWSARVLLDGKEYPRRAQTPWSGAGSIAPSASYSGSIQLSEHEFGIPSSALTAGEHKLALKVGNLSCKEVLFAILAEKRKVSLKIDADRLTFGPAADVTVMATIGNLGATDLDAPTTYWAARVILDGKECKRLAKFVGTWNGPAKIIPKGEYRGGITLTEYGIEPGTLKPGEHKLSLQIGDEKSNELTLHIQDPAQAEALLKKHLAEIAAIKVGGTREALLKVFQPEGGLSTRAQRRYACRANPNIKVDVTFAAAEMPEDKLKESPRDKVLTISEPILESPISDALTAAAPKRDPKFSIAIAAAKDRVSPSGNVELTITLQNLQKEKVSMPWVYGNTRVLFDGKDIGAMGFMVDRGPAELDSQQTFRTAQTLKLGGQPPGAHKVGLQIGDDVSNTLIVDLGWSETVEHLSARLLVGTKDVVEGAVRLSVELELQLAPKAGEMTGFLLDRKALKFAVVDGKGKAVLQPEMVAYGGPVPGPWTVSLTPGKSRRVDVTAGGLSIRRNLAAVLDLGPYVWEFKRGDAGPYYLQASLEVAKDPGKASAWSGTIQLPKVRIPLTAEDLFGRIDEALGFIKKRYQVPVRRIDDHTLGVIWESGAREAFEELKQQIKTEFGIDVKITATE